MDSLSVIEKAKQIKEKGFPSKLYKYRYFDENDFWKDWVKGEVYLGCPSSFNDPFDCSFSCDSMMIRDHFIRESLLDYVKNRLSPNQAEIALIETSDDPVQAFRSVIDQHGCHLRNEIDQYLSFDRFLNVLQDNILVACFSAVNDSILMWSHYASQHNGFCIEYDFANDDLFKKMTYPVIYSDLKVTYQPQYKKSEKNWAASAALSKSVCWAYEREWRFINADPNKSKQPNRFYLEVPSCVRAIYVGARVTENNMKTMCDLASSLSLPVYRMKMDNASFRLYPIKA